MKLSTYIERFMERGWRRESAEDAAILAKEAGVQWDPEEPELPERILPVSLAGPGEVEAPTNWAQAFRNRREAAARYNALGRITKSLRAPGVFSPLIPLPRGWAERKMEVGDLADWLENLLAKERERLQ